MKALYVLIFVFYGCAEQASKSLPAEEKVQESAEAKPASKASEEEKESEEEFIIPLQANEWIDPITELRWMLGASVKYENVKDACGKKYRVPTREEAEQAISNGIIEIAKEMGRNQEFWSDAEKPAITKTNSSGETYYIEALPGTDTFSAIFCIRK